MPAFTDKDRDDFLRKTGSEPPADKRHAAVKTPTGWAVVSTDVGLDEVFWPVVGDTKYRLTGTEIRGGVPGEYVEVS